MHSGCGMGFSLMLEFFSEAYEIAPWASRRETRSGEVELDTWRDSMDIRHMLSLCRMSPDAMAKIRHFLGKERAGRASDDVCLRELEAQLKGGMRVYRSRSVRARMGGHAPVQEKPRERTPEEQASEDFLTLEVALPWEAAISDESGFELVHPDGTKEDRKLSGGRFRKDGVQSGSYRFRFRYIEECRWRVTQAHPGDVIPLRVLTSGMPDGTQVTLKIYSALRSAGEPPIKELQSSVSGNQGTAAWTFEPVEGEVPSGQFVCEAEVDHNWATSSILAITPCPVETARGVNQRLRQLGFAVGPEEEVLNTEALNDFRKSHGLDDAGGEISALTEVMLDSLTS